MTPKPKRDHWAWLKPISDAESCAQTIVDVSRGFYILAVLQGVVGYFIMPSLIIDAVVIAVLAVLVQIRKSRIAAVILCVLTLGIFLSTLLNVLGIDHMGGKNAWLAVAAVWCGVRGVEATFKYHSKYKGAPPGPIEPLAPAEP